MLSYVNFFHHCFDPDNTCLKPDHDGVSDEARGGTRYEMRASVIGGSHYNHRPTLTGMVASDYHGADARNGGFVVTGGCIGGYIPARKEATSALQESEALMHRYRR